MHLRRGVKSSLSSSSSNKVTTSTGSLILLCMVCGVFCMLAILYLQLVTIQDMHETAHTKMNEYMLNRRENAYILRKPTKTMDMKEEQQVTKDDVGTNIGKKTNASANTDPNCTFREYAERRYYGHPNNPKAEPEPSFLKDGLYIRGEYPIILDGQGIGSANKICVDHSSWDTSIAQGKRPFVDAQNPSVMSLRLTVGPNRNQPRLDKQNVTPLLSKYGESRLNNMYIASVTVGNGQCRWKETPEEVKRFRISDVEKAPTVHGELLILDENMERIYQTSIKLLSDAKWGKMKRTDKKVLVELDDTRLFFFNGEPWLFYRNGGNLGYDKQAHSPLHLETNDNGEIEAFIKASEMVPLCCGRNMSIIAQEGSSSMKALTWVDPVTVKEFGPLTENGGRRLSTESEVDHHARRLKGMKSDIHGTNGFMVPIPSKREFLGIAHFHRPEGRGKNPYARHGHHYTHAFFTISDEAPYYLTRISNEFLFKSQSSQDGTKDDGDIIQFAGSIDMVGENDTDGQLLISYGINDCEGATILIDMHVIDTMLQKVTKGDEVVSLMKKHIRS